MLLVGGAGHLLIISVAVMTFRMPLFGAAVGCTIATGARRRASRAATAAFAFDAREFFRVAGRVYEALALIGLWMLFAVADHRPDHPARTLALRVERQHFGFVAGLDVADESHRVDDVQIVVLAFAAHDDAALENFF